MLTHKTLLVIICSNNKQRGGTPDYHSEAALTAQLPEAIATRLLEGRARIYQLIKRGGLTRDRQRIADHPRNIGLDKGPDLDGEKTGLAYLPAAQRYRGSFYAQLGSDGPTLLQASACHVLILSGLYGVVLPAEPIQNYSCHVDDHPIIRKHWAGSGSITEAVLAYVRRHAISQILDFTGLKSYRYLVDWGRIRDQADLVLHCFCEQTTGDGQLIPFGSLVKELISDGSGAKLAAIQPGTALETPTDRVYFHTSQQAPTRLPDELTKQIAEFNANDEIVRMARCMRKLIRFVSGDLDDNELAQRRDRLTRNDERFAKIRPAIQRIARLRNLVEHTNYVASPADLNVCRADFAEVKKWAVQRQIQLGGECAGL